MAIADLPVPETGAIAALPVPGESVVPEQADAAAFRATAGPHRRGFRGGLNSMGSMINSLAGQAGENLGLSDFARDRFQAADEYASMADAVMPGIRDVSQDRKSVV